MKIYYLTKSGKEKSTEIVDISDVEFDNSKCFFEVKNVDEFNHKCSLYELEVESSLENKLEEILSGALDENVKKLEEFEIKHWVSNRSFGELIEMYEEGEITIPIMQRNFVWDSVQCSRLIESIILGLPIPPLFLIEVDSNKYEVIDGLQRLTAISNFVNQRPWNYSKESERIKPKAKLSKLVDVSIAGKSFDQLDSNYQRKIKRSTIPLIEFKQLNPENFDSKYLIFERINTGSQKLNAMQIRKSLASGKFMSDLYNKCNNNEILRGIFSKNAIKKDLYVEAYLRTYVFNKMKKGEFNTKKYGIKRILNEYCERHKDDVIEKEFDEKFNYCMEELIANFDGFKETPFKRVIFDNETGSYEYIGNLSVTIMESLLSAMINQKDKINFSTLKNKYEVLLSDYAESGLKGGQNPFTTSTGKMESIKIRFEEFERIVGESIG